MTFQDRGRAQEGDDMKHPPHFKCFSDDPGFDRITMEVVPRHKRSGLSGDEWRTGVSVKFYRKGVLVADEFCTRMEWALALVSGWALTLPEKSNIALWDGDDGKCMQPGCDHEAAVEYRLRDQFSAQGEGPLPSFGLEYRRRFCLAHADRGDCSREDQTSNYERVDLTSPPLRKVVTA